MNDYVHVHAYVFPLWYFKSCLLYDIIIDDRQPPLDTSLISVTPLDADKHTT